MISKCDQCSSDENDCKICKRSHQRLAVKADRQYDELRESGYTSAYTRNAVEEMERSRYDK